MSLTSADHCIMHAAPLITLFKEVREQPLPSFAETIDPIEKDGCIPDVRLWADETLAQATDRKQYGDLKGDPLPVDNIATIMKYCAEDSKPQFYAEVTSRSYKKDRTFFSPFTLFVWLLIKSMEMLEPYPGKTVNRGVKADLKADYVEGREFVWYGPVSTTKTIAVLSNPMFLGVTGKRTIFQIELTQNQARDISKYSPLEEGEVLLPPGCKFRVASVLDQGDLTIIQLVEVRSSHWILDISARSAEVEQPQTELRRFVVTDSNETYTSGPQGKSDMVQAWGLMAEWMQDKNPRSTDAGIILKEAPHPGGDPAEIVVAFRVDRGGVFLMDKRGLAEEA